MKYLKLFEEFNIPDIDKRVKTDKVKYDFDFYGNLMFVTFYKTNDNVYERTYGKAKGESYSMMNKNPFELLTIITYITKMFIEEYNPDCIQILHINKQGEKISTEDINARAKLNKRFLSKIPNYVLDYYSLPNIDNYSDLTIVQLRKPEYNRYVPAFYHKLNF
jgi:hypothetical protein